MTDPLTPATAALVDTILKGLACNGSNACYERDDARTALTELAKRVDAAEGELDDLKKGLDEDHGYKFDGNIVDATLEFCHQQKTALAAAQQEAKQNYDCMCEWRNDALDKTLDVERLRGTLVRLRDTPRPAHEVRDTINAALQADR